MAQAPWLAPSLSQADQGGAGGRSRCWKVVGKYRGGTKGTWPEFKKSSNRIFCTDVILRKVSRNMSTGANHGDGVKLCAVYQRIEDPFLGTSWSIFRSSVGVWYLLCFAHGNWWWNFVAESDQSNMGHDNIWYSRPRKFGAGSRKCKACSNGCVQFLISETFIWCWCLQAWLDQEIPLEPVQAVLPWVRQGHRLPEAGLVMNIQPQKSIVWYSNLMFCHCWIAEPAGRIW